MGQTERNGQRVDPVAALTAGMRRVVRMDVGDVTQALSQLTNPNAGFLDMLGRTREERVEKMAGMLRDCSQADMEEMTTIFALAMAKVAEDQAKEADEQPPARPRVERERPRCRRGQSSAEWRADRRRAS
jgi:hypothetical protein